MDLADKAEYADHAVNLIREHLKAHGSQVPRADSVKKWLDQAGGDKDKLASMVAGHINWWAEKGKGNATANQANKPEKQIVFGKDVPYPKSIEEADSMGLKQLGAGDNGVVYDIGNDRVMKLSEEYSTADPKNELRAMKFAARFGIGPQVYNDDPLVMEKLIGKSFEDTTVKITQAQKLELYQQLTTLHIDGMAHGDLHGGNVMVLDKGGVKILDYGSATFGDELEKCRTWIIYNYFATCPLTMLITN